MLPPPAPIESTYTIGSAISKRSSTDCSRRSGAPPRMTLDVERRAAHVGDDDVRLAHPLREERAAQRRP